MREVFFVLVLVYYSYVWGQRVCENAEEASNLSLKGLKAFEARDYEKALGYYGKMIEICPSADGYWAMGRCYEEMGDMEKALLSFRKVLESNPSEERRGKAEGKIREIEGRLNKPVKVRLRCEPMDARIRIDGEWKWECGGEYEMRGGKHIIEARKEGYEVEIREVEVGKEDMEVEIRMRKVELKELGGRVEEKRVPIYKKWWFWSAVGGTAAIVGIVTSVVLLKAKAGGSGMGYQGDAIFR